jgi:hypothetical protein
MVVANHLCFNALWNHFSGLRESNFLALRRAGPSDRAVWGLGFDRLGAEIVGSYSD